MGIFSNFFRKKEEKLALPKGETDLTNESNDTMSENSTFDSSTDNKSLEFRKGMRQEITKPENTNEIDLEESGIVYDPQNFAVVVKWKNWYTKTNLRSNYYSDKGIIQREHVPYDGALSVIPISQNQYKIVCTYVDKDQRKPHIIEVGRTKGKSYNNAMHEMDTIIALQMGTVFSGDMLKSEIKRHYDELKKIKDLELSVLGKKIFSCIGDKPMVLPEVEEGNLYNKKIDFMSLPTKQTISQMPITCVQADTKDQLQEEIDEKVEDFYRYCELAIDIGAVELDDNIDYFYDLSKKANTKRTPLYDRKTQLHRESYKEIQDKYLTEEQTEKLNNKVVKRYCSTKDDGNN